MDPIKADSPEAQSLDPIAENIAKLKELFPELLSESKDGVAVNLDTLKQLVGDKTVSDADEKYGLNWHGKRKARQIALTPSLGTLRPCPDESKEWDSTQNLFIEGDNLEVLKLLQKSYSAKIKLIYIDPPYNTGKDFVYKDDFRDNIRNYKEFTGQVDSEGKALSSNSDSSGRYHTAWLNMMYPRLKLARNLLKKDGVILVSVDKNEFHHLKQILNEILGEENFIGTIVWKGATDNNPTQIAIEHEYLLCFGRSKESVKGVWKNSNDDAKITLLAAFDRFKAEGLAGDKLQKRTREFIKENKEILSAITHYDRVDAENELYTGSRKVHNPKPGGYIYDVLHPITKKVCSRPVNGYRFPKGTMEDLVTADRIIYGDDESQIIQIKELLRDYKGKLSSVIHLDSRSGANEINRLFGIQKLFTNPKPVVLLKDIFEFITETNDIVLDFFAGSGTTANAVNNLNLQDGGNRRNILVQLPEPLDINNSNQKVPAKFCQENNLPLTIAELTKERLRRSAAKIQEEHPEYEGDLGFRVFKLDTSNIKAWDPASSDLAATLEEHAEHIKTDRSETDVLYELLLKLGLDLCVPIESKEIAGKSVHSIGGGVILACLATKISRDEAEALATGMVAWHQELAPAVDSQCVFRDSAFDDDVAKTNLAAILDQNGIKKVRSL